MKHVYKTEIGLKEFFEVLQLLEEKMGRVVPVYKCRLKLTSGEIVEMGSGESLPRDVESYEGVLFLTIEPYVLKNDELIKFRETLDSLGSHSSAHSLTLYSYINKLDDKLSIVYRKEYEKRSEVGVVEITSSDTQSGEFIKNLIERYKFLKRESEEKGGFLKRLKGRLRVSKLRE